MEFPALDFSRFNETDVREEVITPLLRKLGYQSGSQNDVIREQTLQYPRSFIGRKKDKDPHLRGKPDYICEVEHRIRWVIEAKDPASNLCSDDIDQAFSYAFHPEVRAVYFVLCNGPTIQVFVTGDIPGAKPRFEVKYLELNFRWEFISNVLSPEAIKRDFPDVHPDYGKPLAAGMRSFARLTEGSIRYDSNPYGFEVIREIIITISGGSIQRD